MLAKVALINNNRYIDSLYTYSLSDSLLMDVHIGSLVLVPFGMGDTLYPACILDIFRDLEEGEREYEIKEIIGIIEDIELTPIQIKLAVSLREKYILTYGEALSLVFPAGVQVKAEKTVKVTGSEGTALTPKQSEIYNYLLEGENSLSNLKDLFGSNIKSSVNALVEKGIVKIEDKVTISKIISTEKKYCLDMPADMDFKGVYDRIPTAHSLKRRVLKYLYENENASLSELRALGNVTSASLDSMIKSGIIKGYEEEELRLPRLFKESRKNTDFILNSEQREVLQGILEFWKEEDAFADGKIFEYAIQGVTGSGKTNVYIELCKETVAMGKCCLVLVPEISLTPQIISRFSSHSEFKIAVFHSKLSSGERIDQWRLVHEGRVNLVIGARSGVFAPFKNLGVVIVDEEHDMSYRSDSSPRYDALEAAAIIAREFKCPVVYGSATLSVKTMHRIDKGEVKKLVMTHRYGSMLPPLCEIVDMRKELLAGNKTILSRKLKQMIDKKLEENEQVILYLNRKGHSTFVSCRQCGYVVKCNDCDISMTYYKGQNALRCNICNGEQEIPSLCPECGSKYFKYFGAGTEKIEEFIRGVYPDKNIQRLDSLITSRKGAMESIIEDMEKGKIDILVGTQLVSKGLDFPNIGLVGIITADTMLNLPDFASQERTFQLINQVSGRAGRGGKRANVIIQTYQPDDYSVKLAAESKADEFTKLELKLREAMQYPPFYKLTKITFSSPEEKKSRQEALKMYNYIVSELSELENIRVLGPGNAALRRVRNRYEAGVVLKYKSDDDSEYINSLLRRLTITERDKIFGKNVIITVDAEAYSLL